MTFDHNNKILLLSSIGMALIYVLAPQFVESHVHAEWIYYDGVWVFYFFVLPGIFGIVVALLLSGSFGTRLTNLILTLGLAIVSAFLITGKVGLDWGSFQVSMILLAVVGTVYVVAGSLTALVASRLQRRWLQR